MSDVIDLVTPPKHGRASAEITFFDLTDETPSPVSAQGISNDDHSSRESDDDDDDVEPAPTPTPPSTRFDCCVASTTTKESSFAAAAAASTKSTTEDSHSSPKRKKLRSLKPRTPPSLGGIADACVEAILGREVLRRKTCDEQIANAGLVESTSDVCPHLQLAESECCPPALNATVPTSSPTANATALGSCQVCPAGITSPVDERIGDGKTCADLLVDKIMNAEESG